MLDDHQFTLLIVAIGLGALLVSFSSVYQKEVDVLTARLEASQGESSGFKEQGNPEANVALTKQKAEISQRLKSLTLSLRQSLVSVLLLLFFFTLLTFRIFLWSWQRQPDVTQSNGPGRFFWFDRALVSVLVLLLLHLCVSHLVLGVPLFFAIN